MTRQSTLVPEFVEYVPEVLADGVIYISIRYTTAVHRCCCGCGIEVATPIRPTDWQLVFDGESVSLFPSIGNWGLPCRSHYWIRRNRVHWARSWTAREIEEGRTRDRDALREHMAEGSNGTFDNLTTQEPTRGGSLWRRLWSWWH